MIICLTLDINKRNLSEVMPPTEVLCEGRREIVDKVFELPIATEVSGGKREIVLDGLLGGHQAGGANDLW